LSETVAGSKNRGGELIACNSDNCEVLACKSTGNKKVEHRQKKIT
jgi:hypothetical protein